MPVDYRFPSPGVDARFPSPGVDIEHPNPGEDARFTSPGVDTRFQGGYGVPPAPVIINIPAVTGTPEVGQTLSATNGSWENSPTSFAYQWVQDGEAIPGATQNTYLLDVAQIGMMVSCAVTATNAGGSTQELASYVGPVTDVVPFAPELYEWMDTQPSTDRPYLFFVALFCRRNDIRVINGIGTPSFDDALDAAALRYPESEHLNQKPRPFWRVFLRLVWKRA